MDTLVRRSSPINTSCCYRLHDNPYLLSNDDQIHTELLLCVQTQIQENYYTSRLENHCTL